MMSPDDELKRRDEEARVRSILEPQDEEARKKWREAKAADKRQREEAKERHRTDAFARWLLAAVLVTVMLAVARWLWSLL